MFETSVSKLPNISQVEGDLASKLDKPEKFDVYSRVMMVIALTSIADSGRHLDVLVRERALNLLRSR